MVDIDTIYLETRLCWLYKSRLAVLMLVSWFQPSWEAGSKTKSIRFTVDGVLLNQRTGTRNFLMMGQSPGKTMVIYHDRPAQPQQKRKTAQWKQEQRRFRK